jgi:hypothetical protein
MKSYDNTCFYPEKSLISNERRLIGDFIIDRFNLYGLGPEYKIQQFICSNNLVDMDLQEIITLYKLENGDNLVNFFIME